MACPTEAQYSYKEFKEFIKTTKHQLVM